MYESFLENVSLLKHLEVNESSFLVELIYIFKTQLRFPIKCFFQKYERENIADALVSQAFAKGQEVVKQASHHKPD